MSKQVCKLIESEQGICIRGQVGYANLETVKADISQVLKVFSGKRLEVILELGDHANSAVLALLLALERLARDKQISVYFSAPSPALGNLAKLVGLYAFFWERPEDKGV